MVEELRQILLGHPGHEAKPSEDNLEVIVTAPPEVMKRVQTFIMVMDWPDKIERHPNFEYSRESPLRAARSFFYACAIEDSPEVFSKMLSLQVLAELKGDTKSEQFENYSIGGVPDRAWEKSLRADWPGKKETMERLVREWNRYPVKRITQAPGVAMGFGVKYFCDVAVEGPGKPQRQGCERGDGWRPDDERIGVRRSDQRKTLDRPISGGDRAGSLRPDKRARGDVFL